MSFTTLLGKNVGRKKQKKRGIADIAFRFTILNFSKSFGTTDLESKSIKKFISCLPTAFVQGWTQTEDYA